MLHFICLNETVEVLIALMEKKMGTFVLWKKRREPQPPSSCRIWKKTPLLSRVSGICCANVTRWVCGTDQNVFVTETDVLFVPRMRGCVHPPPAAMSYTADI